MRQVRLNATQLLRQVYTIQVILNFIDLERIVEASVVLAISYKVESVYIYTVFQPFLNPMPFTLKTATTHLSIVVIVFIITTIVGPSCNHQYTFSSFAY